jgi:hypothetical protein
VSGTWTWILLAGLGAYHGLNPAMGWLFAVALGMQERSRGAVLRALGPIALGHELALVVVVAVVAALGLLADSQALHLGAGLALIAFGIFRFARPRAHPRWTRGVVTPRELTWWSFLMSSAHGAGLMVAPVLIGAGAADAAASDHALAAVDGFTVLESGAGLLLHVGAMVLVMGAIAVVVYEHVGVAVLRRAWINTEWLWAGAFVLAGVITLFS